MNQKINYGLRSSLAMLFVAPLAQAQTVIDDEPDLMTRVIGPDGLSLLVLIAVVFVIVFLPLSYAKARDRRRNELYAKFLEKEQPIPQELLPGARTNHKRSSQQRELMRGVWLTALGLGVGLALYIATSEWRFAAWALVLLFLGAASFINGMLLSDDPETNGQNGED